MEDWCVIDQGDEAGAEALGEADHNLTTLTTSHRLVSSTHRCLASNTVGSQELEKVAGHDLSVSTCCFHSSSSTEASILLVFFLCSYLTSSSRSLFLRNVTIS